MNDYQKTRELIDSLKPIAYQRPGLTVEAVEAAVKKIRSLSSDVDEFDRLRGVLGEAVPCLVAATAGDPNVTPDAMALLLNMHRNDLVVSPYSNHRPKEALAEICSYRTNLSIAHLECAVATLEDWRNQSELDARLLALTLAGNFLGVTASGTHTEGHQFIFTTKAIGSSEGLLEVRRRVVSLLADSAQYGSTEEKVSAIRATENLGGSRYGISGLRELEIWATVVREKAQFIDVFEQVIRSNSEHSVAAEIEKRLWAWWRSKDEEYVDRCLDLIILIPNTLEYRFWKLLNNDELPIDRPPECDLRGVEDRQETYFSLVSDRRERDVNVVADLTVDVCKKYRSADELAGLLEQVSGPGEWSYAWRANRFFVRLADVSPRTAWNLVEMADAGEVQSVFCSSLLIGLRNSDAKEWQDRLRPRGNSLSASSNSDVTVAWIMSIWGHRDISEAEFEFLQKATASGVDDVKYAAAGAMGFVTRSSAVDPFHHLAELVRSNPTDIRSWKSLFTAFDTLDGTNGVHEKDVLELVELIRTEGANAKVEKYRTESGVTPVLRMIASRYPNVMAELIEDTWKRWSDESWTFGPPGILSSWHVMDMFRELKSGSEKNTWAQILTGWIRDRGQLADFAVQHLHDVASLADPPTLEFLDSLVNEQVPENKPKLLRLLWEFKHDPDYIETNIRLLKLAEHKARTFFEGIGQSFVHDIQYRSTSRTPGQISPVDQSSLHELEELECNSTLSREIKNCIRQAKESLRQHIDEELKEDEEFSQ